MKNKLPLITANWLKEQITNPHLVIVDASLDNPVKTEVGKENKIIPGALRFDWNRFSDLNNPLPHTMPSADQFTAAAQDLGLNQTSILVIYDRIGIYSSPRAWWMFVSMGCKEVYVLDGGLPEWLKLGGNFDLSHSNPTQRGDFVANFNLNAMVDRHQVFQASSTSESVIIDARAEYRFYGKTPEPRPGLRSGHIPNSINIPFENLLDGNKMLPQPALEQIFSFVPDKTSSLIFSCGSGVTACINALAAMQIGYQHIRIYDGSWSEWAEQSDYPIA